MISVRTHRLPRWRVLSLAMSLATVSGCGGVTPSEQTGIPASSPASTAGGVAIPGEGLPPDIQCLVDNGFELIEVEPPAFVGDAPGYQLRTDLPRSQALSIEDECQKLAVQRPEKTEAELRVIFDRWVVQRECLVDLGYQPNEPTSFETFVAGWRSSSGPWMPIDGVNAASWTNDEYRDAKERCTLEMFERD